mmetsp:Transcript_128473/g.256640  ORF Transcript_128473/g.256640 Transcript_128473/m.256640 type:complete len:323 (-) Transcript_128473:204-1172(-)|eukprot:CAMPEP_0172659818 /NCGR_PEP_ID=MMETSP1074-20121228/3701_1 /TAXON_ID=2916 /ORGANISM="Ceratium fusus, Strain PA161109" /LENGTH=322 /DNA_ID=CAMNT_0013475377 /DNA_START=59 /DNA_END=1027 /DNA_ORIENTATION=+
MDDTFGKSINKTGEGEGDATENVEGAFCSRTGFVNDVIHLGDDHVHDRDGAPLSSVRRRLADVSDELGEINRHAHGHLGGFAPANLAPATAARAGDCSEARSLEVRLRHVEVDRDEAIARARRLAVENKQLLQVQEQLRAELRTAHQTLSVLKRHLDSQDVHVQHSDQQRLLMQTYQQAPFDVDLTTMSAVRSPSAPSSPAASEATDKRRMRKDRECAERLGALVDQQRGEIFLLRRRGDIFEAYAKECEQRLQRLPALPAGGLQLDHNSRPLVAYSETTGMPHLYSATRGHSICKSAGSPQLERMPRQHSAPSRLPKVTAV